MVVATNTGVVGSSHRPPLNLNLTPENKIVIKSQAKRKWRKVMEAIVMTYSKQLKDIDRQEMIERLYAEKRALEIILNQ